MQVHVPPKARDILWQILLLAALLLFFSWLVSNAAANLRQQGIASGFQFLNASAGFTIIQSLMPFSGDSSNGQAFLAGLLNTFTVSLSGVFLATVLGFIAGISRLSPVWLLRKCAEFYIESVRNLPLLLQIFFWYFVVLRTLPTPRESLTFAGNIYLNNRGLMLPLPDMTTLGGTFAALAVGIVLTIAGSVFLERNFKITGNNRDHWLRKPLCLILPPVLFLILRYPSVETDVPSLQGFNFSGGITLIPEMTALILSLVLYTAAFIGEIVRAGIQSVPSGQTEASRSLGLSHSLTLRLIVIPQAQRVIIPPLTSQYLNLTKNSSLGAAIGYPELVSVFAGTVLNQTGQAVEVVILTMAVYLTISICIALFMNWYNHRHALKGLHKNQ